jgi:hypothetical protein
VACIPVTPPLQNEIGGLQSQIANLQAANAGLQGQLTAARNVLALAPFVSVDPNPEAGVIGPNIVFKGVNVHLISGSVATNDNGNATGLGNLILGYDELQPPTLPFPPPVLDRGGSHNLVIGRFNGFTKAAFGGLVAGESNTVAAEEASVSGGASNTASGPNASVTGGAGNIAGGNETVVLGVIDSNNDAIAPVVAP